MNAAPTNADNTEPPTPNPARRWKIAGGDSTIKSLKVKWM
jgi:hypothetical protein